MKAQIIKINPQQPHLQQAFHHLCQKLDGTNSEITVIVKPQSSASSHPSAVQPNHTTSHFQRSHHNKYDTPPIGDQPQQHNQQPIKHHHDSECQSTESKNNRLFSECLERRKGNNFVSNLDQIEANFNVIISTNNILPNVIVTEKEQKPKSKPKDRNRKRNSLEITCEQRMKFCLDKTNSKSKLSNSEDNDSNSTPHYVPSIKILPVRVSKSKEEQSVHKQPPNLLQPPPKAVESEHSQSTENEDESISLESDHESMFVIEDKLNDAVEYIKMNKLFELEEYLYEFKIKYRKMSDRVQVKWRLLMAHCKENRKEYERASILYQQVLDMAEAKPKLMLVDAGDIYHRLGICYTEIRRWNDGIQCFAKGLKQYRKNDRKIKYAECLNNLGTLYLTAQKIQQAEQCFLQSYEIKKNQYGQHSRKLVSCILNLYECNVLIHNYEQAEGLLNQFQLILTTQKQSGMLTGGLYRRKGKLSFLKGDLQQAQANYQKGLDLLGSRYPFSLEYGQLCHNMGIVKLQKGQAEEARQLLNTALGRLSFYYTKDSAAIMNIKSNLELVQKIAAKTEETNRLNVITFKDKVKQF